MLVDLGVQLLADRLALFLQPLFLQLDLFALVVHLSDLVFGLLLELIDLAALLALVGLVAGLVFLEGLPLLNIL